MKKFYNYLNVLETIDIIDKLSDNDDDNSLDEFRVKQLISEKCKQKIKISNANGIEKNQSDKDEDAAAAAAAATTEDVPPKKKSKINYLNNDCNISSSYDSYALKDMDNPMENYTDLEFEKLYRFNKSTVKDILDMIMYGLTKYTNRGQPIPPIHELLITLKFLTSGSYQSKLKWNVSQPTISRIIKKITTLISELKLRFIKIPDKSETLKIANRFYERGQFPEVFGCVGSTHIAIRSPAKPIADSFLNEFGFYSVRSLVHELMLKDTARNEAYRKAIMMNKSKFKDKIVLDVGAGTGILSIFCAQAGAKKVLAVEASNIAEIAKLTVKENQYENIIDVYQMKIEDFQLPNEIVAVDIIVSEWMGFYLLHEGMLDSLIYARCKFLKLNGLLFPENATMYVAPCSLPTTFDYWIDVNGIKMTNFRRILQEKKNLSPEIMTIKPEQLLHDGTVIAWFDLNSITMEDIKEIQFNEIIVAQKNGHYQGICLWFECGFPMDDEMIEDPIVLSTSPMAIETHWKQTVITLPEQQHEYIEEKYPIAFSLSITRQSESRFYVITIDIMDPDLVEHQIPCDCIFTRCLLANAHLKNPENWMNGDGPKPI